ncbi:hypothetical protein FIBSPDRAFT_933937 [Athelia psychrophila]|uniref:Uncharacterized protein n=1 Tax=Athelia psychrophila TaxID=1759441 RepID=A0A166G8A5_9AGAM|nr:hypothetical protein FIBSPDRAFT_933937 [Fibularhizoctonia sp. CBS 109695]
MLFRTALFGLGLLLPAQAAVPLDTLEARNYAVDRCHSLGCPTRVVGGDLVYETVWGATTHRVFVAAPTAAVGAAAAKGTFSITTGFTIIPSSTEHHFPSYSVDGYEIHVSEGFETLINYQLVLPSNTGTSGSIVSVPAGSHIITLRYTRSVESAIRGSYRVVRSSATETKFGFKLTHSESVPRPGYDIHIDEHSGAEENDLIVTTPLGDKTTLEIVINGRVIARTSKNADQPGSEVAVVPLPRGPGFNIIIRPVYADVAAGHVWAGDIRIVARSGSTNRQPSPSSFEVIITNSFTIIEVKREFLLTLPPAFDAAGIAGVGYVLELHVSPGFDIFIDGAVVGPAKDGQGGIFVRIPGGQPMIEMRYTLEFSGTLTGKYEIRRVQVETTPKPAPEIPSKPAEKPVVPIPPAPSTPAAPAAACTPSTLKPWTKFSHWKAEWLKGPHEFDTNYDSDTEITVTDDENKTERFEILVDGVSVGKTNDFTVERSAHCGANADACIARGWGHGTFPIPAGQHKISIKLIGNDIDGGWWYFAGQYKISRRCGEPAAPAQPSVTPSAPSKPAPTPTAAAAECSATVVKPWTKFSHWKAEWLKGPHQFDTSYDYPTEITVTDDENKTERFEVFVDGVSVGKTNDFTVERSSHCGSNADKCIERGWGQFSITPDGTFPISAGQHKIGIKLIGNDIDGGWWYFAGQYKIARSCFKLELIKDEL